MKSKNLLVTGGCGFIGSAFVRKAISSGFNIINIDALTYAATLGSTSEIELSDKYCFVETNIIDKNKLEEIFSKYSPDAVIHFAAESHVDRSIESSKDFIETNIIGTYNLLEVSRSFISKNKKSNFRFLHISTDEVYGSLGNDKSDLFTENTRYDPRSPYSASKASSDHLVRAWNNTYKLPTLITNCSNNYGPFQFPEKLIPKTIAHALSELPITIYGDGSHVRDWLFVDDHVDAIISVLQNGKIGSTYNVGGNNECSNYELVNKICNILEQLSPNTYKYSSLIKFVKDRPGHDERYAIDSSKISSDLGWAPSRTIDDGLLETVQWYLSNQSWWQPLFQNTK